MVPAFSTLPDRSGQLETPYSDRWIAVGALTWPGVMGWVLAESRARA